MFLRRGPWFLKDPLWFKVSTFSLAVFFITLADALISFWAPNLIEDSLGSSVLMGLVIGFQSLIGFAADLVFPKLLRYTTVRRLLLLSILTCLLTLLSLVGSSFRPLVLIFLLSMTFWGLYYELMAFAQYQFVADSLPPANRSGAWGIIGIFKNLAYFLGPLLAAVVLISGSPTLVVVVAILLLLAYAVIAGTKKVHEKAIEINMEKMNVLREIKHWLALSRRVWPIMLVSFILGCIDATFWTTGAVLTEKLSRLNPLGSLFLPLYALPSFFTGLLVAKMKVAKGKKKLAEVFLLLAGIPLLALLASDRLYWQLLIVFLSSLALSFAYPLIEGVYSDIDVRLGKEKKHLIGLTSSIINLSYIVWPVIAGLITLKVGERMTFTVVGILTIAVASILLAVTPKKLKLPQTAIKSWPD